MDVHPPHEPIDSWRAFFIHLATITIGLLIAISLEAIVEFLHHRHAVHSALETIQTEIQQNRSLLKVNLKDVKDDEARIREDLKHLVALRNGEKIDRASLEYFVSWSSFPDSAWRTARDTSALSFMNYQTAQELSDLYKQQELVTAEAIRIYGLQTQALASVYITNDLSLMSKEETQLTLQRSADLLLDLRGLEQLLAQLDLQFEARLAGAH